MCVGSNDVALWMLTDKILLILLTIYASKIKDLWIIRFLDYQHYRYWQLNSLFYDL